MPRPKLFIRYRSLTNRILFQKDTSAPKVMVDVSGYRAQAREAIEQTLLAARLTASPAERVSLLTVALNALDSDAASLPADWVATTRMQITARITRDLLDRAGGIA